jgi:hypothetical protein
LNRLFISSATKTFINVETSNIYLRLIHTCILALCDNTVFNPQKTLYLCLLVFYTLISNIIGQFWKIYRYKLWHLNIFHNTICRLFKCWSNNVFYIIFSKGRSSNLDVFLSGYIDCLS